MKCEFIVSIEKINYTQINRVASYHILLLMNLSDYIDLYVSNFTMGIK